ncbi:MAG TPA: TetR/AcrR family transcriptional regulator C-terminal domain-containing protein [Stellaceae bacterium]|nr:TetR/AcrR family transcriptional regulator C-terminal domain-containing protein [Stellaceae bacterium]
MPTLSPPGRRPGRPRDLEKRAAIVQAAMCLFLKDGFAVVTMEAVAAAAAVSKVTLYRNFPDKEVLFEEAVGQETTALTDELFDTQAAGGTLAESLCALGRAFLALVCRPEVVSAERTLPISLASNPALAKRFFDVGPGRIFQSIADTLAQAVSRGELVVEDPLDAAMDLLSLWQGDLQKRLTLGLAKTPTADEIADRVARKTAIFLRAYGP